MKNNMKTILGAGIAALFLGLPVTANENSSSAESSADTSRNPVTGTVTRTRKYKKAVKSADGSKEEVDVKKKTKVFDDGTVEKSVEKKTTESPQQ